jgi:oxalate decarboxylase/phosphoglucose isomerase-like protein (cupin superfamily)
LLCGAFQKLEGMKYRQKSQWTSLLVVFISLLGVVLVWYMVLRAQSHWFDDPLPYHHEPSKSSVDEIPTATKGTYGLSVQWPDIVDYSPDSYPQYRSLLDIISNWNPDNPDPPPNFRETLQHFNYSNPLERKMAELYRDAEVPFKLYGIPDIDEVRSKWTVSYLASAMNSEQIRHVEKSKSNHFMFWTKPKKGLPKDFIPPTETIEMTFEEWITLANHADQHKLNNESSHYYYMIGSRAGDISKSFVARDLNLFSTESPNFFITNPKANKGIQCRFAMRGIISECHYDSGKNMIAMMHGAKRYILTPPHTCKYLGIISDKHHPSFRHSVIDWSDVHQAQAHHFDQVDAIDTIVQEGEVLYVPSFWFHYIISLNYAIQCNSRSGFPKEMNGVGDIEKSDCMNTQIARRPPPELGKRSQGQPEQRRGHQQGGAE